MLDKPTSQSREIRIGPEFRPFLDDAIARFSYLYPDVSVAVDAEVTLSFKEGTDEGKLIREFQFALYRQKIFAETLPLRKAIISGVMGR